MPLPRLKLTYTFIDESEQVVETRLFRCTADEIAFERRFGFPVSARLAPGARSMREAEKGVTNGDAEARRLDVLAAMSFEDRSAMMRSEDTAFFAWCVWQRYTHSAGIPAEDFDSFVERLAALELNPVEEAPDPTPAAPLG